eukprot:1646870-Prymnesium_polylepis.1
MEATLERRLLACAPPCPLLTPPGGSARGRAVRSSDENERGYAVAERRHAHGAFFLFAFAAHGAWFIAHWANTCRFRYERQP